MLSWGGLGGRLLPPSLHKPVPRGRGQRVLSWAARSKTAADPPRPPSPQAGGSPESQKPIPKKGAPILLWGQVGPASSLRIWTPWVAQQELPDGIAGVGAQPRGARGPSSPCCPQGDPRDGGHRVPATGSPQGRPLYWWVWKPFGGRSGVPACWLSPANSRPANHRVFN